MPTNSIDNFDLPPIVVDSAALISPELETCVVPLSTRILRSPVRHKLGHTSDNTDMEARIQQHHSDHSAGLDAMRSFLRGVAKPITMTREKYIDSKILKEYHINLHSLSFTTGQLHSDARLFFDPIPPAQISEWLAITDSAIITEDFAFPDFKDNPIPNSPINEAVNLWSKIELHLTRTKTNTDVVTYTDVLGQTNWHGRINDIPTLNRRNRSYGSWQAQMFLLYHLGPHWRDRRDPTKPHISCFLADDAPLQKNVVSTSELATLIVLACNHAATRRYEHVRHIPVLVVSGSGRHIRVVQGILDTHQGSFELRMSEIISFEKGIVANQQNFLTLLGWIVANPVGTSPEHEGKQRAGVSPLRKVDTARN